MAKINDGGPAFPMPASEHSQGGHFEQEGMSLRDWFAGQALIGLMEYATIEQPGNAAALAKFAYDHADAMLAVRTALLQSREATNG
jgi:hypothetical protein